MAVFNDTSFFHDTTKTTINYTDNLAPMPNSQDFLSDNLAEETENIWATQQFISGDIDKNQALLEEEYNETGPAIMENRGPIVFKDFLVNGNSCEINLTEMMQLENVNEISNGPDEEKNITVMAQTNAIHENPTNVISKNPEQPTPITITVACETDQMVNRKALAPLLMAPPAQLFSDTPSTPQIVNDVFEMVTDLYEKEDFDLITYIDQNEVSNSKHYLIFVVNSIIGSYNCNCVNMNEPGEEWMNDSVIPYVYFVEAIHCC